MVKLRLSRRGRKAHPIYDIVAVDGRGRRDGQYLERIGQYSPMAQPSKIILDSARALYWLHVGAQPTDVVRALLSAEGVMLHLHLERKGKNAAEIAAALDKHKAGVANKLARLMRKKEEKKSKKASAAKPEGE